MLGLIKNTEIAIFAKEVAPGQANFHEQLFNNPFVFKFFFRKIQNNCLTKAGRLTSLYKILFSFVSIRVHSWLNSYPSLSNSRINVASFVTLSRVIALYNDARHPPTDL